MDKYSASANESEILPNLMGLTDAPAIGLAEFEGFLRADIVLTEALAPATQFTLNYLLDMHPWRWATSTLSPGATAK